MFRCQKCGDTTKSKEKCNKIITQTKDKNYINTVIDKHGVKREKITHGYEIVKELNICEECFKRKMI